MANRNIKSDKCRICAKESKLSFEHVPPKAAYNKKDVIEYQVADFPLKRKVKGKRRQGGIGEYTLCERCNNDTGAWYGNEYGKWAKTASDILVLIAQHPDAFAGLTEIPVILKNVHPLRFLKQVVTCFFSIVGVSPGAEFAQRNPALQSFVLDRYERYLPPDYQFFLRLDDSAVLRRNPLGAKLTMTYRRDQEGNIIPGSIRPDSASIISDFAHPPFALAMTHCSDFPDATNITYFKDYEYDENVDLVLLLAVGRSSNPYPGSYDPM